MQVSYAPLNPSTSYTLLELPPELLSQLDDYQPFEFRGHPTDDTALCTTDKTYAVRAVKNSNTLLLCLPTKDGMSCVATLHQTLDASLTRPRVRRLHDLLANQDWANDDDDTVKTSKKIRRFSRDQLADEIQASPAEYEAALHAGRILQVGTVMRPAAASYLVDALSTLLLVLDEPATSIPAKLAEELEVDPFVADQILGWFASGGTYDQTGIVKELGQALLFSWKTRKGASAPAGAKAKDGMDQTAFLAEWRSKAGDRAEAQCTMSLLEGLFIQDGHTIRPVHPLWLPLEPAARFAYLFSLRPRWRPEDMQPFLHGLAASDKEREKWVLKCVRKVKEGKNTIWLPR